jgi:hypothetical protein
MVILVGVGALQFTHNLLGYMSASAGHFTPPLGINASVATGAVLLTAVATPRFGLDGFAFALVAANAAGVLIGGLLVGGRTITRPFPTLGASVAVVGLAVAVAALLNDGPGLVAIALCEAVGMILALRLALALRRPAGSHIAGGSASSWGGAPPAGQPTPTP